MKFKLIVGAHLFDPAYLFERIAAAAAAVAGVLERYQRGPRPMDVIWIDRHRYLFRRDPAPIPFQGTYLAAGIESDPAAFVDVHMGIFFADYLIAGLGMTFNGDLIGHGTAGTIQRGLHSEKPGGHGFQGVNGWVLAENIIAYLGGHHGFEHSRCRTGHRIRAKVNGHISYFRTAI